MPGKVFINADTESWGDADVEVREAAADVLVRWLNANVPGVTAERGTAPWAVTEEQEEQVREFISAHEEDALVQAELELSPLSQTELQMRAIWESEAS